MLTRRNGTTLPRYFDPSEACASMHRMAIIAIAPTPTLLCVSPALTRAYGNYDIRKLLVPASKPGAGGSLNLGYFDRMVSDGAAFGKANFERLLRDNPDDALGKYHYSSVLADLGRAKEALPNMHEVGDEG